MAKDEQSNQLNLTVVALVALVAIVGLVALVMNAASIKNSPLATGSQLASAQMDVETARQVLGEEANLAGQASRANCMKWKAIAAEDGDSSIRGRAAQRLIAWEGCR